jgi:hypothetical protein
MQAGGGVQSTRASSWWRRRLVFLAVLLVSIPLALVQPVAASASNTGTLFAITGQNQNFLSEIDPASGDVTPIVDLAGPDQAQVGTLTGDPATGRLFGLRQSCVWSPPGYYGYVCNRQLVSVDSQTGEFSVGPSVKAPITQIAFDASANILYGLWYNAVYTIDPATGLTRKLAGPDFGDSIVSMAVVPGGNAIYVNDEIFNDDGTFGDKVFTIDPQSGRVLSSPMLAQPVRIIAYDPALGQLFGATECSSRDLVKIDPSTGNEDVVSSFGDTCDHQFQFAMTIDPTLHTAFMDLESLLDPFDGTQIRDQIVSVNEETGANAWSLPIDNDVVWSQYFMPVMNATTDSIKGDVQQASTSGAISNTGVAGSLMSELSAAASAMAASRCGTAANLYQAFISDVHSQTGISIAVRAAGQLELEARFLIAHCS